MDEERGESGTQHSIIDSGFDSPLPHRILHLHPSAVPGVHGEGVEAQWE